MLYVEQRAELIEVVNDLIRFRLLDCTGGMLAVRCGSDHLLMTTFGAGFRRWCLGLDDFIVCDIEGDVVEMQQYGGPASLLIVLEAFRTFPTCGAVLHSHAEFSLAYASLNRPFDGVPCLRADDQQIKDDYLRNPYPVKVPAAMPHRPEVVAVNQYLLPQLHEELGHREAELASPGLAFTTYRHGITVLACNLDQATRRLAQAETAARGYIRGAAVLGRA
jgi:ribulose-5-phosphate 4-epimerase/fuculose-1-phosphate aldolase